MKFTDIKPGMKFQFPWEKDPLEHQYVLLQEEGREALVQLFTGELLPYPDPEEEVKLLCNGILEMHPKLQELAEYASSVGCRINWYPGLPKYGEMDKVRADKRNGQAYGTLWVMDIDLQRDGKIAIGHAESRSVEMWQELADPKDSLDLLKEKIKEANSFAEARKVGYIG